MTFGEVRDGIGKNLGLELADEGGAAAVQVDGNTIIFQAADDDLVLLHADLGEIAPENRDRVLAAAMEKPAWSLQVGLSSKACGQAQQAPTREPCHQQGCVGGGQASPGK